MIGWSQIGIITLTVALGGCSAFRDPYQGTAAGGILGASLGTSVAAIRGASLGGGAALGGGIGAAVGLASGLTYVAERDGWFESDLSDEIAANYGVLRSNNHRIAAERQRLREAEAQFPEPSEDSVRYLYLGQSRGNPYR